MSHWLIIVVLSLLPWKASYHATIAKLQVEWNQAPCHAAAWANYHEGVIHICHKAEPGYSRWIVVHEVMHMLEHHNLTVHDWQKFERAAMKALRQGGYSKAEIESAKYYATYGPRELHAELPSITKGNIPVCLQGWYPWLNLEVSHKSK